ncbi:MAG: four helix bundle protein [Vicingus serpentipes]|nr:four helix bundle protein [Vicingus serpentipes]
MQIVKFEDIIAWKKAQDLAVEVYGVFKESKDFGFRDQICRATVSISNNIAEGFDRSSNADFKRFLFISLASCSEVRSMLYLAERLNYLDKEKAELLRENCIEISKITAGFIKSLNTSN